MKNSFLIFVIISHILGCSKDKSSSEQENLAIESPSFKALVSQNWCTGNLLIDSNGQKRKFAQPLIIGDTQYATPSGALSEYFLYFNFEELSGTERRFSFHNIGRRNNGEYESGDSGILTQDEKWRSFLISKNNDDSVELNFFSDSTMNINFGTSTTSDGKIVIDPSVEWRKNGSKVSDTYKLHPCSCEKTEDLIFSSCRSQSGQRPKCGMMRNEIIDVNKRIDELNRKVNVVGPTREIGIQLIFLYRDRYELGDKFIRECEPSELEVKLLQLKN